MTKNTIVLGLVMLVYCHALGQTRLNRRLDEHAYQSWPALRDASITGDGNYVAYRISQKGYDSLYVKSIDGDTKMSFRNVTSFTFSLDSRFLLFQLADTLQLLELKTLDRRNLGSVTMFRVAGSKKTSRIVYISKPNKDLMILEPGFGIKKLMSRCEDFALNLDGSRILARKTQRKQSLIWFDRQLKVTKELVEASYIVAYIMGDDGRKCSFITKQEGADPSSKLYFSNSVVQGANLIYSDSTGFKGCQGYRLSDQGLSFGKQGKKLFFTLEKENSKLLDYPHEDRVTIWKYNDSILPSQREHTEKEPFKATFAFDVLHKNIQNISNDNNSLFHIVEHRDNASMVYTVIRNGLFYDRKSLPSLSVFDYKKNALKEIVKTGTADISDYHFSPDGEYILWFDNDLLRWKAYSVKTRKTNIIELPHPAYDEAALQIGRKGSWGLAGWIHDEGAVLLYDQYDVWKVYLNRNNSSICLTDELGRKSKVTFTVIKYGNENDSFSKAEIMLSGYSFETKSGGYFTTMPGKPFHFQKEHLKPYSVKTRMPVGVYESASGALQCAAHSRRYLVVRERADQSANVFVSEDLNDYKMLSSIQPEKLYNWMKSELTEWFVAGQSRQGILYRPAHLELGKKYPLILTYYEKRSDALHKFLVPKYSEGRIDIPSFIQEGYLVFVPDIHSRPGHNGEGTYESVMSAADYLSGISYVDTTKMGLQGHSYGGWQTNYLITHTNRFAAACEVAGVSDQVSAYGQVSYGSGNPRQQFYEVGSQGSPYGIGNTPWTTPNQYLANSPIFRISNVKTPLLMVHNKQDAAVPYEQALEFFLGLRRAGKQAWMLEYKDGGHQLAGDDAKDFHIKMLQFFDYFLKAEKAPTWIK